MTSRILPPDEWPKLAGTEAEALWPKLPHSAQVLVVEDAGRIVGTWILMTQVHAECVWIAPDHRGSLGVVKRLLRGMRDLAASLGVSAVLTGACSDDVRNLIQRLGGTKLPGDAYVLPLGETRCQPQ